MKGVVAAVVACLGACCLFVAFDAAGASVDPARIRATLRQDFRQHPEVFENGASTFVDCEILAMTIDREPGDRRAIISPNRLYGLAKKQRIRDGLRDLVLEGRINPATHISVPYHQYWSGMRSVLSLLLPHLGVGPIRLILCLLTYASLALACVLGVRRLLGARGDRSARIMAAGIATICFGLLFLFELGEKSRSFRSAPTDILFFLFLALLSHVDLKSLGAWRGGALLGLFGALVGYFEMLHGAIPVFLAAITGITVLQMASDPSRWQITKQVVFGLACFSVGVALCLAVKLLLVALLVDSNALPRFLDLLMYRLDGTARGSMPTELAGKFREANASPMGVMWALLGSAERLAFGSRVVGIVLLVVGAIVLVGAIPVLWFVRDRTTRTRILGLLASSAVVVAWYLAFQQHSMTHMHVVGRIAAWPLSVATCFVLAASWSLVRRR